MTTSQNTAIRAHLEAGHTLTALEALDKFGCLRLSARVKDLRDDGMTISRVMVETETGKWVARYAAD